MCAHAHKIYRLSMNARHWQERDVPSDRTELGKMETLGHLASCSAFLQQPFGSWCPLCQLVFAGVSREVDVAGGEDVRARGEGWSCSSGLAVVTSCCRYLVFGGLKTYWWYIKGRQSQVGNKAFDCGSLSYVYAFILHASNSDVCMHGISISSARDVAAVLVLILLLITL